MRFHLAVLSVLIGASFACGSRSTAPDQPTEAVSACGPCDGSQTCISYFEVGVPETEKHTCERACVPGANSCASGNECTMDANGPGFVCRATPPQPSYDRETQNIADLIRIWGDVRFMHPAAVGGVVDWEAALLENIDAAAAAGDDNAFFDVVGKMLSKLGDPLTRVEEKVDDIAPPKGPILSYRMTGSRLVVDFGGGFITGVDQVKALRSEIEKASEIVFDLRGMDADSPWAFIFAMQMLNPSLASTALELPSTQTLLHQGYKPQGFGSTFFYTALEQTLPELIAPPKDSSLRRVVFVLGEDLLLPAIAVPLWHAGLAHIVAPKAAVSETLEPTESIDIRGRKVRSRVGYATFKGRQLAVVADVVDANAPMKHVDTLLKKAQRPRPLPAATASQSLTWPKDKTYEDAKSISSKLALLAVARIWTVIEIFYPYENLIGDWDRVLPEFVDSARAINTWDSYIELIARMSARVQDDHAWVSGDRHAKHFGEVAAPFEVRVLRGAVVVSEVKDEALAPGVEVGDVLLTVDSTPVATLYQGISGRFASSTPARQRFTAMNTALRGPANSKKSMTFASSSGKPKTVEVTLGTDEPKADEPKPKPYRVLEPGIGYVDLRELTRPGVGAMLDALKDTRAIIMDMRGYPRGSAFPLAPRLSRHDGKLPIALIEIPTIRSNSDFREPPEMLTFLQRLDESKERYEGDTVMLIDERAISQSEHSGLAFHRANNTIFIGTETAGANGDVTSLSVPGGLNMSFSTISIRHVDGRQLQRVGLVPDIRVEATVEGLRQGKDEVLDAALQHLRAKP